MTQASLSTSPPQGVSLLKVQTRSRSGARSGIAQRLRNSWSRPLCSRVCLQMAAMHCSRRALLNRESRGCLCRLFLSADPPPALERPLPISILQASIKLTNEPPEGLKVGSFDNLLSHDNCLQVHNDVAHIRTLLYQTSDHTATSL